MRRIALRERDNHRIFGERKAYKNKQKGLLNRKIFSKIVKVKGKALVFKPNGGDAF